MGINDKIKQILIDKNISPSYFADEIGVQRSSISHILSGRNRPSFDIIQKIIRRFPELGYDWIMEEDTTQPKPGQNSINAGYQPGYATQPARFVQRGRPPMPPALNEPQTANQPNGNGRPASAYGPGAPPAATYQPPAVGPEPAIKPPLPSGQPAAETPVANTDVSLKFPVNEPQKSTAGKQVDRILVFYTDGTFREFTPSAPIN